MTAPTEYASFLDRLTDGRDLPTGCDTWGMKSVRPDGRTYNGYQWPLTPKLVKATNVDKTNTGPCPSREGDGLCVAANHYGMASGGIPARTLLLLAYHSRDVLGLDEKAGKCRVSKVRVVAVIDGERAIREHGHGSDLRGSDLHGSDLHGSDLSGSDLRGSDLRGSNLSGSDLRGSYLSYSDLRYSDLHGSNLHGSNLSGSDLRDAYLSYSDLSYSDLHGSDLHGLDLSGSDLRGSDLSYSDLRYSDLRGSDLSGSDLRGSDLRGSDLRGAYHSTTTRWPDGWTAEQVAERTGRAAS